MGSPVNQNPFTPYYNYRDCSLGICTIYCPQFCYLSFPPPQQDDSSSSPFSPLIIVMIVVLASAFLLVSYYLIVTRYCKNRRVSRTSSEDNQVINEETIINSNQLQMTATPSSGLDETLIKMIAVCKYRKGEGLIEGNDCAVCLSEFQENEPLRLLPKCNHAFHLPCIDTWLKSHSNCPLCRAVVIVQSHQGTENSTTVFTANAHGVNRPNDLVLVVDDQDRDFTHELVVLSVVSDDDDDDDDNDDDDYGGDDINSKRPVLHCGIEDEIDERDASAIRIENQDSVSKFKRSVSLGTVWFDSTKIEQVHDDLQVGIDAYSFGIGSSKGFKTMKRSVSTGRFVFKDSL